MRWIVECGCPGHVRCQKKRNCNIGTDIIEPLAFLAAWSEAGHAISEDDHRKRDFIVDPVALARWSLAFGDNSDVASILSLLD